MKITELLFGWIGVAMKMQEPSDALLEATDQTVLPQLYALAKSHDMAHMLTPVLEEYRMLPYDSEEDKTFQKQTFLAVYRYEQSKATLEEIEMVFERASIPFVPLKGAVLRERYPEPWMRTSCDIDVLVHEEDAERAVELLVQTCAYRREQANAHDIPLFTPSGVHVEVHFDLIEDFLANNASTVLSRAWDYAYPVREGAFRYVLPDAIFYSYHVAHMAKHLQNGGCGIRPFLDLWILDHTEEADQAARDARLEETGLLIFANAARKLSRVWFSSEEKDPLSEKLEFFLLEGGTYGTVDNRFAVAQGRRGSKGRYLFSRVFQSREQLARQYPVLNRHAWLLPVCQVRRWFKIVFRGRIKYATHELQINGNISNGRAQWANDLMEQLHL